MPTGPTPGRRPNSSAAGSVLATASGTWCSERFDRQEDLQQIVQEALPQGARRDALAVAHDEPTRLGVAQRLFRDRDLQAGALGEQADGEPVGQAQGVHHEFEHEVPALDLVRLLYRPAFAHALEVLLGLLPARAARHALGKAQLAVRARTDAEVVPEAPIVEI